MLTKAVEFTGKAQTDRGGWGYVSAADGGNFDEGSVTITQLQALRAARNAGIVVPKAIIDKAVKYLKNSTTPRGGVIYSLAHGGGGRGGERPPLTAAAVACAFSAGEYNSRAGQEVVQVLPAQPSRSASGRVGHDEYSTTTIAQAMYVLGDDGYDKLFPKATKDDRLTWSEVPQGDVRPPQARRRTADGVVERRLHRPGVRDRDLPDHPATGERQRCRSTSDRLDVVTPRPRVVERAPDSTTRVATSTTDDSTRDRRMTDQRPPPTWPRTTSKRSSKLRDGVQRHQAAARPRHRRPGPGHRGAADRPVQPGPLHPRRRARPGQDA